MKIIKRSGMEDTFDNKKIEAAIRRGARYVDIEIEAPDEHLEYIRTLAREYGCRLIVSFHDFECRGNSGYGGEPDHESACI